MWFTAYLKILILKTLPSSLKPLKYDFSEYGYKSIYLKTKAK